MWAVHIAVHEHIQRDIPQQAAATKGPKDRRQQSSTGCRQNGCTARAGCQRRVQSTDASPSFPAAATHPARGTPATGASLPTARCWGGCARSAADGGGGRGQGRFAGRHGWLAVAYGECRGRDSRTWHAAARPVARLPRPFPPRPSTAARGPRPIAPQPCPQHPSTGWAQPCPRTALCLFKTQTHCTRYVQPPPPPPTCEFFTVRYDPFFCREAVW